MAAAFHSRFVIAHVDSLKKMRRLLSMLVPGFTRSRGEHLDAAIRGDEEPVEAQAIDHPGGLYLPP